MATISIHRVTMVDFVMAIMRECKRRRKMAPTRYRTTTYILAEHAGYCRKHVLKWENGVWRPTLRQALDCLEATV